MDDGLARIQFTLENRTGRAHETGLTLAGLPAGEYSVAVGGRTVTSLRGDSPGKRKVSLPVSTDPSVEVTITRTAQ